MKRKEKSKESERPKKTMKIGVLIVEEDSDDDAPEEFTAVEAKKALEDVRIAEKKSQVKTKARPRKPRIRDRTLKTSETVQDSNDEKIPLDVLAVVGGHLKEQKESKLEKEAAAARAFDKKEKRRAAGLDSSSIKGNINLVVLDSRKTCTQKSMAAKSFLKEQMTSRKRIPIDQFLGMRLVSRKVGFRTLR